MSSRTSLYDVTYQLRAHKRDRFIEFIKSLLLTPFILSTKPKEQQDRNTPRYLEILGCIEELVEDHINCIQMGKPDSARLNRLVPSLGYLKVNKGGSLQSFLCSKLMNISMRIDRFQLEDSYRHRSTIFVTC